MLMVKMHYFFAKSKTAEVGKKTHQKHLLMEKLRPYLENNIISSIGVK